MGPEVAPPENWKAVPEPGWARWQVKERERVEVEVDVGEIEWLGL
jgi:hypothetical protein